MFHLRGTGCQTGTPLHREWTVVLKAAVMRAGLGISAMIKYQ